MCYVRIDTFQGRKKIQAKSTKQYLGIFKEIEDITRWREDMNFTFEWQEQYLTSERSE